MLLTDPNDKLFTIYWRYGKRDIVVGHDVADAFRRAGFGGGALAAVDWYADDANDTHYYDTQTKQWVKRLTKTLVHTDALASELTQEQLREELALSHDVEIELSSKNKICMDLTYADYEKGHVQHLRVYLAFYNTGPYHDDGEETHHYIVGATHYFHPKDVLKAAALMLLYYQTHVARERDPHDVGARKRYEEAGTQPDVGSVRLTEIINAQPTLELLTHP